MAPEKKKIQAKIDSLRRFEKKLVAEQAETVRLTALKEELALRWSDLARRKTAAELKFRTLEWDAEGLDPEGPEYKALDEAKAELDLIESQGLEIQQKKEDIRHQTSQANDATAGTKRRVDAVKKRVKYL